MSNSTNATEKDDGSCRLIHSPSCPHTVSLIPQQSVLFHKEDYTSGTRGFPGMAHSYSVCWLSVSHSVIAMVTSHLLDIILSTNLTHLPQGRIADKSEIWSSRVIFLNCGDPEHILYVSYLTCSVRVPWSGAENHCLRVSLEITLILSLFLVWFFSVFLTWN